VEYKDRRIHQDIKWARRLGQTHQFIGDGLLASGSGDKTIKLWNIKTGESTRTLNGHGDWVRRISFYGKGLLASGCEDKTIKWF